MEMQNMATDAFWAEKTLSLPIDQFGKGTDYSTATMRLGIADNYGLANEFIRRKKPLSSFDNSYNQITKQWEIKLPPFYWMDDIPAGNDGCCWVAPGLQACQNAFDLDYLCLKWCNDRMEELFLQNTFVKSVDIQTPFGKTGKTLEDTIKDYNKAVFAWLTARNIVLGRPDITTDNLKPFHGVLEYMSSEYIVTFDGSSLYGALKQLDCRHSFLNGAMGGAADRVIAVHPLTYRAFEDLYESLESNSNFPLRSNNGRLSFDGIPIVTDQWVPMDPDTQLGEAWVIDFSSMGLILINPLYALDKDIRRETTETDDIGQGCLTICNIIENVGGIYSRDFNRISKIVNIPLSAACAGNVLQGLRGMVEPTTLIPGLA